MIHKLNKPVLLRLITFVTFFIYLALLSSCADLNNLFKPTNVDRISFIPECKNEWKGKTIFIDFAANRSYWSHRYASNLAYEIKDKLMEDVVEDGCFHVQDKKTGARYTYKVGVRVASPVIKSKNGFINSVSASYRIKTYDSRGNLVKAKTRTIKYKRPMFVVVSGDSQSELLLNYAHNVSVEIRKIVYKSLRDNLVKKNRKKIKSVNSGGKYKTSTAINFRSAPSIKSNILTKLEKNTEVTATGKTKGSWWEVKIRGSWWGKEKTGWLHSKYLKRT